MTATKFHELLSRAIAEFEHGLGCFEAPEIASNPSNGNIAVLCKACGKVVVLTQSEQRIVGPEPPPPAGPGRTAPAPSLAS